MSINLGNVLRFFGKADQPGLMNAIVGTPSPWAHHPQHPAHGARPGDARPQHPRSAVPRDDRSKRPATSCSRRSSTASTTATSRSSRSASARACGSRRSSRPRPRSAAYVLRAADRRGPAAGRSRTCSALAVRRLARRVLGLEALATDDEEAVLAIALIAPAAPLRCSGLSISPLALASLAAASPSRSVGSFGSGLRRQPQPQRDSRREDQAAEAQRHLTRIMP